MGRALGYRPFADALQQASQMLGPMNRDELRSAVKEPAELQGARFEIGLIERILDDVGEQPGNLPLLEFALTLLWDQAEPNGVLTHAAYEWVGKVDGGLRAYAEQVYGELKSSDQATARRIFMQLLQPGRGTEDTRRLASRDEIGEENWCLVHYLADKRLVVTNRDASGVETAILARKCCCHRSLGTDKAVDGSRQGIPHLEEALRASIYQWQAASHDAGGLLRGAPRHQARTWAGTT